MKGKRSRNRRRADALDERAERAEALTAEAMSAGLAECERLRKMVARWQEALLCNAPECSQCYRPATWERLTEDDEGTSDEGVIADLRCDHHKPADGEWIERAFVEELRTLGRFAEVRAERLKTLGMEVFERVLQRHESAKDGAQ